VGTCLPPLVLGFWATGRWVGAAFLRAFRYLPFPLLPPAWIPGFVTILYRYLPLPPLFDFGDGYAMRFTCTTVCSTPQACLQSTDTVTGGLDAMRFWRWAPLGVHVGPACHSGSGFHCTVHFCHYHRALQCSAFWKYHLPLPPPYLPPAWATTTTCHLPLPPAVGTCSGSPGPVNYLPLFYRWIRFTGATVLPLQSLGGLGPGSVLFTWMPLHFGMPATILHSTIPAVGITCISR